MALWSNTDVAGSKPKFLSAADKAKTFFVSQEEALLDVNKTRGITGAGWWIVDSYTDSAGSTRHKAECIVAMTTPTSISGDAADDAIVADVTSTISISAPPAGQNTSSGGATFSITATATTGTVTYQWQRKAAGATRWANVSGETSATIALTGQTAAEDGDQYRVVLNSDAGAAQVTSTAATLTFVD